jgi:hypothetical protein
MASEGRSGRVLDDAVCIAAPDGSGVLTFTGSALVRLGYAAQSVITLPTEPTAALSWALTLNGVGLFSMPGGASLGPMTILDGDTLTFTCATGLVAGETYRASLIGFRQPLDDPQFQFLLPLGVGANVPAGGGSVGGITKITSAGGSINVTNPTGPTADLAVNFPAAVTRVQSGDGRITVTNPTGPAVTLSLVRPVYKSLAGTGEIASPGDLTQTGGLKVAPPAASVLGFDVESASGAGIRITSTSTSPGAGIVITDASTGLGANGISLTAAAEIDITTTQANIKLIASAVAPGHGLIYLQADGDGVQIGGPGKVGFYETAPIAQQSGAGITTVPQLVAALQNLGLLS